MTLNAFSEKVPELQLAWDASSLKSFQFCPRHYQYANLQGWQSPSVDLAFGRLIASGLERYQKARLDGKTREEAILVAIRWALEATWNEDDTQWGGRYETMWKCEGTEPYKNQKGNRAKCPFAFEKAWFDGDAPNMCGTCGSGIHVERRYVPNDNKKNRVSLVTALIWYGLDQPEELDESYHPYVFPDGTPAVELSGKLPLPWKAETGEQYILTWNIDYIGQWGTELFITDNKTTGKSLNEQYFAAYSPDTQFDTYDMVGSIAFPALEIRGTMVEGVQLMVGGVAFGKHPYYKTEAHREEHLADLEHWIKLAEHYAMIGYWPMNKRSCWLCPFKQVCSQAPSMRDGFLKSNFVKQERWNPLHER